MRRLLVAEPALVQRRAHLLLVTEPLQVLGRDGHPRRLRRGRRLVCRFGGHEAIIRAAAYGSKAGRIVPESRISQMLALLMPSKLILFNVSREYVRPMAT